MSNLLLGAGILTGGLAAAYAYRMWKLSKELEVQTKVSIWKISGSGLTIRVDVMLKNPTSGSMTLKYPFVKMQYKGSTIATSEVKNEDTVIPSNGQKQLEPIYITIGFLAMATSVPALVADFRKNGKLNFDVSTSTTIDNFFSYIKNDSLTLGPLPA